jgi:hypothetical protein
MNPAGQIAGSLRKIRPAASILNDMITQADEILRELSPRAEGLSAQ